MEGGGGGTLVQAKLLVEHSRKRSMCTEKANDTKDINY